MKTVLFPGQGSQARGMGADLFRRHAELTRRADEVLGYSIEALCLEDPERTLNQTRYTQPAIYTVSALAYFDHLEQHGAPDYAAGHSLGEFNALLAAGCFDFETGLKLVRKRAELMSLAGDGAMAAVLNLPVDRIRDVLAEGGLDRIDIANLNAPGQVVISGDREQMARAQAAFQQARAHFIPLNTSGAFHSRFMAPARQEFAEFLAGFEFAPPRIPVVANVTARPYVASELSANLASQITDSVRWVESIEYLLGEGHRSAGGTMSFVEVGHGDVLTKLLTKIRSAWTPPPPPERAPAPAPAPASGATARERVERWNRECPVGTPVRSTLIPGEDLKTRTEAVVLFQHRAAVYLQGYGGYFDLEELSPIRATA